MLSLLGEEISIIGEQRAVANSLKLCIKFLTKHQSKHHGCLVPGLLHCCSPYLMCNYNCANIILEDDMIAKLADFGLPMELPQVQELSDFSPNCRV